MTTFAQPRRQLLLAAAASLAGCGGGGEAGSGPSIAEFSADRPGYFVGDSAQLRVRYAGGAGRIEPGIGSVGADATVGTGVLERSTAFRLTVTGSGGSVTREVMLPVAYRDRHRPVAELQIAEHAAAALDDGTVLVIGGSRAELNTPSYWIERIDPQRKRIPALLQRLRQRSSDDDATVPIYGKGGLGRERSCQHDQKSR